MLRSAVQNATKTFRLTGVPSSVGPRVSVSTTTAAATAAAAAAVSGTPQSRTSYRLRIGPTGERIAARRWTHSTAKWRPVQALDE